MDERVHDMPPYMHGSYIHLSIEVKNNNKLP